MPKVKIAAEVFNRYENAFWILGTWNQHARRQGWSKYERDQVLERAKVSSYSNLLRVILTHTDLTS